jgi:hypothetical protein
MLGREGAAPGQHAVPRKKRFHPDVTDVVPLGPHFTDIIAEVTNRAKFSLKIHESPTGS